MKKKKIILMRHGESKWNKLNKFTGWQDIGLTKNGKKEAKLAAKLIKKNNFIFDIAYTSILKRAIYTLWIILKKTNQIWIPVYKSWKLNERNYGALEGLNKEKIKKKYGDEQVQLWRRSFTVCPPNLNISNKYHPIYDIKYKKLKKHELPTSESLEMTFNRVIPFWEFKILPQLEKNKNILIVAHGNSLRALIKYLGNISDSDIIDLDISTGKPLVYEFSNTNKPLKYYYL
ncbi:2,3-diphosphoglycerate-dependent phosphoglycerate mutase [Buchnera aphidicola]|uniref:2,3-bisphosphoglycerate-dependent phosphoglycerate mutase n=1 Tax=Buchnera aphidicola subsp. Cinara cedri (strain Cc) TaxID=372461 RepID=GPMA_BUCCC|nr:2,3-diphosphoglycerate-dependent phosphoglycerate mutase [Buchnera aphidicola]Q057P1.1 RecName: Full=2,3-bisphosphoglycerate-dependent phosphoglycerate mutase; Short=BPG-dependent PGAM; Short=PGAM; Short=Phosphoglyceromutase; Short=dPGM [Buchnera aphidicola BCc]ABJ90658.1 phosphoglycerate mutase [Buchnera aphidicola BCc]